MYYLNKLNLTEQIFNWALWPLCCLLLFQFFFCKDYLLFDIVMEFFLFNVNIWFVCKTNDDGGQVSFKQKCFMYNKILSLLPCNITLHNIELYPFLCPFLIHAQIFIVYYTSEIFVLVSLSRAPIFFFLPILNAFLFACVCVCVVYLT